MIIKATETEVTVITYWDRDLEAADEIEVLIIDGEVADDDIAEIIATSENMILVLDETVTADDIRKSYRWTKHLQPICVVTK